MALQGEGFYYNEVTGDLSTSAITLRAFHVPTGTGVQQVYVNMITHLTTERIKALVDDGVEFSAAVTQAEQELVRELGITEDGYTPSVPGTSMKFAGEDNADNAFLLGVSAAMIQLAIDSGTGSIDAACRKRSTASRWISATVSSTRHARRPWKRRSHTWTLRR